MSAVDIQQAKQALTWRLKDLGVPNPHATANEFIDELVNRGWVMDPNREQRPHPPKAPDACPVCNRHELSCICPPEERPDRNGGVWRPSQPAANVHEHTEALRALVRQSKESET